MIWFFCRLYSLNEQIRWYHIDITQSVPTWGRFCHVNPNLNWENRYNTHNLSGYLFCVLPHIMRFNPHDKHLWRYCISSTNKASLVVLDSAINSTENQSCVQRATCNFLPLKRARRVGALMMMTCERLKRCSPKQYYRYTVVKPRVSSESKWELWVQKRDKLRFPICTQRRVFLHAESKLQKNKLWGTRVTRFCFLLSLCHFFSPATQSSLRINW